MKKVVIVGAFDRYNYGDNLMPVLFELFLKEFYPGFFGTYRLVFSALTSSDLSRYSAKKSVAISVVFEESMDDVEAVICIGGEVLCASSSTLFLHMDNSKKMMDLIYILKRVRLSFFADLFCRSFYRLPWEYPYIPKKKGGSFKVAFNTIGGGVSTRNPGAYLHAVRSRLSNADYLSVRDTRTESSLAKFCSPYKFPDSAITMAYFAGDEFLAKKCSPRVNELSKDRYICFQAAPKKVGASIHKVVSVLKEISGKRGVGVKLCPIGYASGHDDIEFLREIQTASNGEFDLVEDLNVWEIMSVIRGAEIFIGTSLHGVITALSFSVPYIGLNRRLSKLDGFISDWGISTSSRCYSIDEVPEIFDEVVDTDRGSYLDHSKWLCGLGMKNNHKLVRALGLD